jgi:nucleoside-diphosphate-sugar epimerase
VNDTCNANTVRAKLRSTREHRSQQSPPRTRAPQEGSIVNVTVLGATGGIGRAIVTELAHRGHTVTAASRSAATSAWPTGVRALPTDLRDQTSARAACEDADVVVMAAQIPYSGWVTELTPMVDAAIDAAGHAGARLVMVDNLYGYGFPDGPIT